MAIPMRREVLVPAVLAALSLFGAAAAETRDGDWRRCGSRPPDIVIAGCTAVIQAAREAPTSLSVAFNKRGRAHLFKDQLNRAIEDFDQAIRLNPNDALAFINRGAAKIMKGDFEDDIAKVRRLHPEITVQIGLGFSGKLIGAWSLNPDGCTAKGLPEVQVIEPPIHGTLQVVRPSLEELERESCAQATVPGTAVFYSPEKGYRGVDLFSFRIISPTGANPSTHYYYFRLQ